MAIEQESNPDAVDLKMLRRSAIENEIPTYRAVSTRAVFALICGLLAGLSFTHPLFYLFAVAAVLLGWSADRAIRRHPDILTGGSLARAGVALGLVFGLSIFTVTSVQHYLTKRQAGAFASEYAGMLRTRPLADLYWIQLNPTARATLSPEDNLKQMQGQAREEATMADMKFAGLRKLVADLNASDKNSITFSGIESLGKDELIVVALARYDVHLDEPAREPAGGDAHDHSHDGHDHKEGDGHDHKEGEEHKHDDGHDHKEGDGHDHSHDDGPKRGPIDAHAMAVVKGMVPEGKTAYEWWVDDVVYPYEPKSAELPASQKRVDDGHGHAH